MACSSQFLKRCSEPSVESPSVLGPLSVLVCVVYLYSEMGLWFTQRWHQLHVLLLLVVILLSV